MPASFAKTQSKAESQSDDKQLDCEGDGYEDDDEDIMLLGTTPQVWHGMPQDEH